METPIISLKDRMEMPFTMVGGENYKIKVVDLTKAVEALLKQRTEVACTVEIRPIKVDRYKETRITISYSKDQSTGIFYGIPIGVHVDGNVKWRKITLTDRNVFDLRNPEEAKMWFCARISPWVIGSPFSNSGIDPVFEIFDPEQEAAKVINHSMHITKALNRAKTMKKSSILNFARYLGVMLPTEYSDRLIRAEIIKLATINPVEFNNKFDDTNRKLAEVLYSGIAVGVIQQEAENGYVYKGVHLGLSEPEALKTLLKESMTLSSVISSIKEIDRSFGADVDLDEEEDDK